MRMAWRNFIRNRRSSLASIFVMAAITAFLLIYTNNIRINKAELDNSYATIPVDAYMTSALSTRLPQISKETYQAVMDTGYVSHVRLAAKCDVRGENGLMGLNDISAYKELSGYIHSIEWLDGYDTSMFGLDEPVCLAPRSGGAELGSVIKMQPRTKQEAALEFTVVGLYGAQASRLGAADNYFCPLQIIEFAAEKWGQSFSYCVMEMELCNTQGLNDFKLSMKELGLESGAVRLVINDALLLSVTYQLQRNVRLLTALLPLLFLLIAAIGFSLSYLMLRIRRREAAVMRSLGASKKRVFFTLLMETAMQAIPGAILGSVLTMVFFGVYLTNMWYVALALCAYMLGGAVAAYNIALIKVLKLMTAKE